MLALEATEGELHGPARTRTHAQLPLWDWEQGLEGGLPLARPARGAASEQLRQVSRVRQSLWALQKIQRQQHLWVERLSCFPQATAATMACALRRVSTARAQWASRRRVLRSPSVFLLPGRLLARLVAFDERGLGGG